MRRAGRVDGNHERIVNVLRLAGCSVLSLADVGEGVPDLLVYSPRIHTAFLAEVKDGARVPSERALTGPQLRFVQEWAGPVFVVTNETEALAAADGSGVTAMVYEARRKAP
ncbi:MAG TPA: hypothetical protein VKW04_24900 [Planctomycetota bacterium]|nr:hypothetical protein [Planctomycetota bacterium]